MLRVLLIFWLVISNLGYGMVVLADAHGDTFLDSESLFSHHPAHNADHQESEADCDHCCHGLIHLLGLINTDMFGLTASLAGMRTPYAAPSTTPPPIELYRPPITT